MILVDLAADGVQARQEERLLAVEEHALRAVNAAQDARRLQLLQAGAAVDLALPNIVQPHLLGDGFLVLCRRVTAARLLLPLPLEADQV